MTTTTLFKHPSQNKNGKWFYNLKQSPFENTSTYLKSPTMIYLLQHAPHAELTAPKRTTQPGMVKFYQGSKDPNTIVSVLDGQGFVYILGDLNGLKTQLDSKYDYQLKRLLRAEKHIIADGTEAKMEIRAALVYLGKPAATNQRVYYLPALLHALTKFKRGTAKKLVSVAKLAKLAILWFTAKQLGSRKELEGAERGFVDALSRWDSLLMFQQHTSIWKSKKHNINDRDAKRLARAAHKLQKLKGDEATLPSWLHSIVSKFEKHLAVKPPKEDLYLTAAHQFSHLTGYNADLIQKSNCAGFGLDETTGASTFARWTLETENMFYDLLLYLENEGTPAAGGAFKKAQEARHQLFTIVPSKKDSGRINSVRILKEPDSRIAHELLNFFNSFEFKQNEDVYTNLVNRLAHRNITFNIECNTAYAKQKNVAAHRLRRYKMADMNKLVPLYLLRDEICGRPCQSMVQFVRALFTERASVYVRIFYCVVARANLDAAKGAEKRKATTQKRPSSQHPELFGMYILPLLDVQHAVSLHLYGLNKAVWARFFVNYFRIFLEKEFSCRIAPMVTLNLLSRKDFNRLNDRGLEHLSYGIHIVVDYVKGQTPMYAAYKCESKSRLQLQPGQRAAKSKWDISNKRITGDLQVQMCEWANECKSMLQNEPWVYADTSTTRHHMTNFEDSSGHFHDVECHNFPQNEVKVEDNMRYIFPAKFDLGCATRICKQSVEDLQEAYENVVMDLACDTCKTITEEQALRATKGKKTARQVTMSCGHLYKGKKIKMAKQRFIEKTKVNCYINGEWVKSGISFLPYPPINARDYGTWGMVKPTQWKQEHKITNNLNDGFNSLWRQVAQNVPLTLDAKVFNIDENFTFSFTMKEGVACVYSGGTWTKEKMETLKAAAAGNVMVHVSTFGRYHETQMKMAQNEYVKVFNITTPQYVDEANRNERISATAMAHESQRIRQKNYLVSKDKKLQDIGRVLPGDIGERDADGNPTSRLIGLAANNKDEFPWANQLGLQPPGNDVTDFNLRSHSAALCSIAEQSMVRYRLEKHQEHRNGLKTLENAGITDPESSRMIQWDIEMVEASRELWKANFPEEWAKRRTWSETLKETALALVSPKKRARYASVAGSSKRMKRSCGQKDEKPE